MATIHVAAPPSISCLLFALMSFAMVTDPLPVVGQDTGSIRGTVTRADDGTLLAGVTVLVDGTGITAVTDRSGRYLLQRVSVGPQTVVVRALGFRPVDVTVTVRSGGTSTADAALTPQPIQLRELVVTGASRVPERIVEAPAAVSVVDIRTAHDLAITGQAARALDGLPGVVVVQNGVFDYNVNGRGLNSSLNRRVLILQDGRDLAFTFLGTPSWGLMSNSLDDMRQIEMVRGPGSALYGANAYNGVVSFTTSTAREAVGTRLSISGGELSTFKGDIRHGGVTPDGRFGYKIAGGYYRSDTWARSRTSADNGDLRREYAPTSDDPVPNDIEVVPLSGQTLDPTTRAAVGDRDAVVAFYGSGRFDYYLRDGSVATLEGGSAWSENQVFVTNVGRVQSGLLSRPWVRASWAAERFNLMAWYGGEAFIDPNPTVGLASGAEFENQSSTLHAEAQFNAPLLDGRGRVVAGASIRNAWVNTQGTLFSPQDDDRSDQFYSVFGQIEFNLVPKLKLVGAGRIDEETLINTQFSPKGAVVFSPNEDHAVRLTVNRAFQRAAYTDLFIAVPAGAPANFSLLEAQLRASPLGPALADVPVGALFTNSAAVPILVLGNDNLSVEKATSYEVGYRGQISERFYLTVDVHYSRYSDFVTDALPGANPAFLAWTAPAAVPDAFKAELEQTVNAQLAAAGQGLAAAGLTRLPDGSTAIVLSVGNAGQVDEYGIEVAGGVAITPELQFDWNYAFFEFEVDSTSVLPGDEIKPNSPQHRVNVTGTYRGRQGLDVRVRVQLIDGYDWASGRQVGLIPARQFVEVSAAYRINSYARLQVLATNVFNQERYLMYGGSVIGRRVLGGVTVTF